MLDIKFIKENKDLVQDAARKKRIDLDVGELLEVDERRRELVKEVEDKKALQNEATGKIARTDDAKEKESMISAMQTLKKEIQKRDEELKKVMERWQELMLRVPNIPDLSVPEGDSDEDNKEIKQWGDKPNFDFTPKSHMEIMENLGMADFERGSKVHGFRGYFLTGDGAKLSFAIWNYALSFFAGKGFEFFIAPSIVKKKFFYGTGHLPNEAEDLFQTQDEDFLSGTAEVPMMAFHSNEVLGAEELPKKYLAFSPCFRREAGSYGKDTKGLIRVHEFYKLEQVVLCEASHEESVRWHEELNGNTEEFIETLGIPYRTVINSSGDLGLGQVKKYDIELWVPLEEKYREISSASYFHDFQSRRFNIKYKSKEGKNEFVHSLNSTAIPTPRILVSLIENYQQADGSVVIPEVLRDFLGKEKISV